MELPAAFHFIVRHNETIFVVLMALILATGILYLIRVLGDKGLESSSSTTDVKALETALQRALSQVPAATVASASIAPAPAASGVVDEEDATTTQAKAELQARVVEKEKKIEELETALAAAQTGGADMSPAADAALAALELQGKIKELEARLAEYAIIEDDIADLSLYKEENKRLKDELEALRAGGASAAAAAPAAAAPSAIPITPPITAPPFEAADKFGLSEDDDVMKDYMAAVSGGAVPDIGTDVSTSIPPMEEVPDASGDFDLAQAEELDAANPQALVDSLLKSSPEPEPAPEEAGAEPPLSGPVVFDINELTEKPAKPAAAPAPAPASKPEPTEVAAEAPPAVAEQAMVEEPVPAAPTAIPITAAPADEPAIDDPLAGALDTSKMLEEVAGLAESGGADDDVLDGALDTDKLLLEVNELDPGDSSDVAGGDDLFGEFNDLEKKQA